MEACDVLVADMWKESIGSNLSIIRARQQGKQVILLDPNHVLLRELFQFHCADLDFGIYRIMNHKREVVERFKGGLIMSNVLDAAQDIADFTRDLSADEFLSLPRGMGRSHGLPWSATWRFLAKWRARSARVSKKNTQRDPLAANHRFT